MGVTQYIGSRYVPIFGRIGEESIQWDNTKEYEPLTIVLHEGNSFTSRQYVPVGIDINNEDFWAITGNYNAQVEQYRREVQGMREKIETETTERIAADEKLDEKIETETKRAEAAESANTDAISKEIADRTNAIDELNTQFNTKLDAEIERAKEAESTNADAISKEISRATESENAILDLIDKKAAPFASTYANQYLIGHLKNVQDHANLHPQAFCALDDNTLLVFAPNSATSECYVFKVDLSANTYEYKKAPAILNHTNSATVANGEIYVTDRTTVAASESYSIFKYDYNSNTAQLIKTPEQQRAYSIAYYKEKNQFIIMASESSSVMQFSLNVYDAAFNFLESHTFKTPYNKLFTGQGCTIYGNYFIAAHNQAESNMLTIIDLETMKLYKYIAIEDANGELQDLAVVNNVMLGTWAFSPTIGKSIPAPLPVVALTLLDGTPPTYPNKCTINRNSTSFFVDGTSNRPFISASEISFVRWADNTITVTAETNFSGSLFVRNSFIRFNASEFTGSLDIDSRNCFIQLQNGTYQPYKGDLIFTSVNDGISVSSNATVTKFGSFSGSTINTGAAATIDFTDSIFNNQCLLTTPSSVSADSIKNVTKCFINGTWKASQ